MKLGISNGRFLKIEILKNMENSLETQNKSKEINKLSYWNSRQQIPNCQINSEIKGNIYKLFDKLWHWKLQKVTGNSTLRTYEKFGNTLFDGLRGEGMVCSYFSEERRLLFNFMQKIILKF